MMFFPVCELACTPLRQENIVEAITASVGFACHQALKCSCILSLANKVINFAKIGFTLLALYLLILFTCSMEQLLFIHELIVKSDHVWKFLPRPFQRYEFCQNSTYTSKWKQTKIWKRILQATFFLLHVVA